MPIEQYVNRDCEFSEANTPIVQSDNVILLNVNK